MKKCRRRHFFKYGREHFAFDALDSCADHQADLTRLVPNPDKTHAIAKVAAARADLINAQTAMTDALAAATAKAGEPGNAGKALVEPAAGLAPQAAQGNLQDAQKASRNIKTHLPLSEVRPGSRQLHDLRNVAGQLRVRQLRIDQVLMHPRGAVPGARVRERLPDRLIQQRLTSSTGSGRGLDPLVEPRLAHLQQAAAERVWHGLEGPLVGDEARHAHFVASFTHRTTHRLRTSRSLRSSATSERSRLSSTASATPRTSPSPRATRSAMI